LTLNEIQTVDGNFEEKTGFETTLSAIELFMEALSRILDLMRNMLADKLLISTIQVIDDTSTNTGRNVNGNKYLITYDRGKTDLVIYRGSLVSILGRCLVYFYKIFGESNIQTHFGKI